MRILLDENLPVTLKKMIIGHDVTTVYDQEWQGLENGELLSRIEGHFDLFVTSDSNIRHQHELAQFSFGILELWTNRLPLLIDREDEIQKAIENTNRGDYNVAGPPYQEGNHSE